MARDDDVGKVYVGGVLGLEEADLRKEFEPFGKVRRAWVARNPPGFAFLWFEDPLDAEDACRDLNAFAGPSDLLITTTCVNLGSDYAIAFRESFLRARPGDFSPGPVQLHQAIGRTQRDARFPFAPYTGPDGEVHAAGYSSEELHAARYSIRDLRSVGIDAARLTEMGAKVNELWAAGFSTAELKAARLPVGQIRQVGASDQQLREAGYTAEELKAAGATATSLAEGG